MSAAIVTRKPRASFQTLAVCAIERLTPDAVAVSFSVPPDLVDDFAFEPGQHLTLRTTVDGQDARRSYSICISRERAVATRTLRVASSKIAGGLMSTWLNDGVAVGDRIEVMTPLGGFTCPVRPDLARHHVAIAAGSGITPVMSLLTTALASEPESRATLVFGNRRTDSVMFLEELEDLKNTYPGRFHLIHVLSREAQDVELFSGRIDRERLTRMFETILPPDTVDEWYLCGPYGMVEDARSLLRDRGVDDAHVHHEVFHVDEPGGPPPPVEAEPAPGTVAATVTVNLDGRTTVITMPSAAESILDATLRERPDAPFSCTGGICGTCRARLVDGDVRMDRNYALEPEEVAAGIVLACQSHPVTPTVALDYDA